MKAKLWKKILISLIGFVIAVAFSSCAVEEYSWRTDLVHAIEKGDLEATKLLLQESGKDINRDGNVFLQFIFGSEVASQTPFEAALYSNDLDMLREVLSYEGVIPYREEENPVGWVLSAVNDGSWQERHEVVKLMFEKGLEPDAIVDDGMAVLCCIAGEDLMMEDQYNEKKAQGIQQLYAWTLERSENKMPKDDTGTTPLHWAIASGNLVLAEYLIEELNYTINQKNDNGETPIIFLFKDCYKDYMNESLVEEVVLFCIEQSASLSTKDLDGNTAYDYAKSAGFDDIANLLVVNP